MIDPHYRRCLSGLQNEKGLLINLHHLSDESFLSTKSTCWQYFMCSYEAVSFALESYSGYSHGI